MKIHYSKLIFDGPKLKIKLGIPSSDSDENIESPVVPARKRQKKLKDVVISDEEEESDFDPGEAISSSDDAFELSLSSTSDFKSKFFCSVSVDC